jgi:uncharacterized membrane protein YeiB
MRLIGMGSLQMLGLLGDQDLPTGLGWALAFWLAAVAFSVLWRARFQRDRSRPPCAV